MSARRALRALAAIAVLSMTAVACQVGVSMWSACSPSSTGNPFGTDGEWVLVCRDGTWEPVMTVDEFVRIRRGEHVTHQPLPGRPTTTTTTTTTTTQPPATMDVDNELVTTDLVFAAGTCNSGSPDRFAQSFTAGRTGELTRVDLVLAIHFGSPDPALIEIRDVAGNQPGPTVLGSASYDGSGSPDSSTLIPFELAAPVSVEQGSQYFIVVSAGSSCPLPGIWRAHGSTMSEYPDGDSWVTIDGNWFSMPEWGDLSFRTWVR